jgi:hypothetical protein
MGGFMSASQQMVATRKAFPYLIIDGDDDLDNSKNGGGDPPKAGKKKNKKTGPAAHQIGGLLLEVYFSLNYNFNFCPQRSYY